jgi:hypothetical protein
MQGSVMPAHPRAYISIPASAMAMATAREVLAKRRQKRQKTIEMAEPGHVMSKQL